MLASPLGSPEALLLTRAATRVPTRATWEGIPRTSCGGNFCLNALLAAEIVAAFQKISRKQKSTPQPKQNRRNTGLFFSGNFRRIPADFRRIPADFRANRGVDKTETKFCRNSKKTPQIRKKCRKSKKAPFFICGRNFCRNESLGICLVWRVPFVSVRETKRQPIMFCCVWQNKSQ